MALARVKTWVSGEVLLASDLNSEFNNLLNNSLSLISPLTASLNAGGFKITNYGGTDAPTSVTDVALNAFVQSGTGATTRTLQAKLREVVSIFDFMSVAQIADVTSYTGSIDLQSVFMTALAASKRIFCPPGAYKLATAVTLAGGEEIVGVNGVNAGDTGRTIIKPTTVAFKSSAPTTQLQQVTFQGLLFQGGTNPLDLALFHQVRVQDCQFADFTGCGIVLVRGERHLFQNIEFVLINTLCDSAFAFGDYTKSVDTVALSGFAFGVPGQWVDRNTMIDCRVLGTPGSATGNWGHAIWCGASNSVLSGTNILNFVAFGGTTGIARITLLQHSEINNVQVDSLASGAIATAAYAFRIDQVLNSSIKNTNPSFAGNVDATVMFEIANLSYATIENCYAAGNNATTFGFRIGTGLNQNGIFIGCRGSILSQSSNTVIRDEVQSIGCEWTNTNIDGGTNLITKFNQNFNFLFLDDGSAVSGGTADLKVTYSTGSGNSVASYVIPNSVSGDVGDAAKTLSRTTHEHTQQWISPLTADRAVTLSTTGAQTGHRFRIVRRASSTGAFNLNVGTGPLKALAAGQWCDVEFAAGAWIVTAFGSL